MTRQNTTIRIDPALKHSAQGLAHQQHRSLSDLIEDALLQTYPELRPKPEEATAA